jgi:hypothetical protein
VIYKEQKGVVRMRTLLKILLSFGIVALIVGLVLYFTKTEIGNNLEVKHQILYLVPGIIIWVIFILLYILFPNSRRKTRQDDGQYSRDTIRIGQEPTSPSNVNEPTRFEFDPNDNLHSETKQDLDFMTQLRINRLVEKREITIEEAEIASRQTNNMDFLERERFLSAIEHRKNK